MPDIVAWVFPGQGAQDPGMGADLFESSPAARALFDRADAVLGRPLSALCFDGPAEALSRTDNAQPAIFTVSMACLAAAREAGVLGESPAFVAGHSMGEYSALCAAGALSFDDGLRLVAERGRLTQLAAEATPGRMAALLGLDEAATEAVCAEAGAELCNINAPGQLVIGGTVAAIERACALALERGAKRAIPLDVGGAFHTSLMQPAVDAFRQAVSSVQVGAPSSAWISNKTADRVDDPSAIGDALVYQLTHPVRWVASVQHMVAQGAETMIEIGPGRVLTGLIKRIAPGVALRNINGTGSLSA